MKKIKRTFYLDKIASHLRVQPICAILGARQVGKTTLAREFAATYPHKVEFFDLENPTHLSSLDTPFLTLRKYADHLIVIDEIQRRPELFPVLRVLVDDPEKKYRFLILGSASRDLIQQSSESLAGRIGYVELPPLTLCEVGDADRLLMRGGFPRSYLAASDDDSYLWREGYISTFLERDLSELGFNIPSRTMRRFWMMLCFYHGQIFNASEIANSLMISDKTAKKYLDILAGTLMIRILPPWIENIKKRQVKSAKIYFRDSGIYTALSSIHSLTDLLKTPKIGPLWEGFALEEIINCLALSEHDSYFWSSQNMAEIDLLTFKYGKKIGFEIKYTDSPRVTKSLVHAIQDLSLDHAYIVFPGTSSFSLAENVTACGLEAVQSSVLF